MYNLYNGRYWFSLYKSLYYSEAPISTKKGPKAVQLIENVDYFVRMFVKVRNETNLFYANRLQKSTLHVKVQLLCSGPATSKLLCYIALNVI